MLGPRGRRQFVSYNGIEGGFEALCISGAGSVEERGILQRHGQGCVERSEGLEDPILPLSVPTGVQLGPTSPRLVEKLSEKSRMCLQ
jgi:hypothetical protein